MSTTTTMWPSDTTVAGPLTQPAFDWQPKSAAGDSEQAAVVSRASDRVLKRWLRSKFASILLPHPHR